LLWPTDGIEEIDPLSVEAEVKTKAEAKER